MDDAKERVMEAFSLLDDAQRRRLVFLASMMAQSAATAPPTAGEKGENANENP